MSYLQLLNGIPDFKKAVISLWFKVPSATMQAAYDMIDVGRETISVPDGLGPGTTTDYYIYPPFNGIVPLMIFGNPNIEGYYRHRLWKNLAIYNREWLEGPDFHQASPNFPPDTANFGDYQSTEGPHYPLNPCYIGIDVNSWDGVSALLAINLQLPNNGSGAWLSWNNSAITCDPLLVYLFNGIGAPGAVDFTDINGIHAWVHPSSAPFHSDWTATDATSVLMGGQPEQFLINNIAEVTPDTWHHLLISFDIDHFISATGTQRPQGTSGPRGTLSTGCKLWATLDDVDQSPFTNPAFGLGPNDLATGLAYSTAQTSNPLDYTIGPNVLQWGGVIGGNGYYAWQENHHGFGLPNYSYAPSPIPSSGYPLAIPASTQFVDNIHQMEMAELQIFTGVAGNVAVESVRRAFIDFQRNVDGSIKTGGMVPVDPKKAQQLLGRRPAVLLHGNSNWIAGGNTGSLGTTDDGETIAAGQFKVTAKIKKYKPEPELGK